MGRDDWEQLEKSIRMMSEGYRMAMESITVLKCLIETDDLTHLLRRRAFMEKLEFNINQSLQRGTVMQIMMIDIDHFKQVNDRFGHQVGDEVLERVSDLVRSYLRPYDLAGRYGGEEIIIAVECDDQTALSIAERIRTAVEKTLFESVAQKASFHVTISLGMASTKEFGYDISRLIAEADAALYRAKSSGRNRTLYAVPA